MKRKAQGLSINAIIVAVIALIVLVVLVAVFTGNLGNFNWGLKQTTNCDQICKARGYDLGGIASDQEEDESEYTMLIGARDGDQKQCWCKNEI